MAAVLEDVPPPPRVSHQYNARQGRIYGLRIPHGEPAPEPRSPLRRAHAKWLLKPYILPCRALYWWLTRGGGIAGGRLNPRKLINHLTGERKFTVEKKESGIYIVKGDILPIQIIDSRKLSEDENVWLKGLDNQLDAQWVRRIADKIAALGKDVQMWAYLDAIARANEEALQEAYEMSDTAIASLKRTFERIGFSAEWENRGRNEGREETARNALAKGLAPELIHDITGLDMETIQRLAQ
ncbi:MAG: hypothetical protein FWC64_02980 [Treponema sp.]|nr:hypothetical protein [Treponema sp.]